jgi:RNA polymerase-binding transcription factor DksA
MPTSNQRTDYRPLRDWLDARRHALNENLQLRIARIREHGSNVMPLKEADESDLNDLDVVLVEIATVTLRRIDEAIERLDDGRYGFCTRCFRPIAEARLRAMPFAVCCRQCESERESAAICERQAPRRPFGAAGSSLRERILHEEP